MRSLGARLFIAILGVVLLAVGASLALGIVLTRDAVRETIRRDIERQADAFTAQLPRVVGAGRIPPPGQVGPPRGGVGPGGPPAVPVEGPRPVQLLLPSEAARLLPASAIASLRASGSADGTAEIEGRDSIFAARRTASGHTVVLVTRPDLVTGSDFSRYLSALLIAGGAAALLAAAVAALLARRLTQPLRRLSEAAGELAAGRHPEPVPPEGTEELDRLAGSFNEMSEQLALARDAERAVLLSVSHDLRTPLTSIRGYAEGIEDGTIEPHEAAHVVGREAERLERLVGDLLALARLRQGVLEVRREPVDLGAVAREAEERLRPRAAEVGVALQVGAGSALVVADHGRVLQVLTNLLENAIRVSPEGGRVLVETSLGQVAISDEGPGIPEGEILRAFEPVPPPRAGRPQLPGRRRPRPRHRPRADRGDGGQCGRGESLYPGRSLHGSATGHFLMRASYPHPVTAESADPKRDPWRSNEEARRRQVRKDARRPLAVNLAEGLALSEYVSRLPHDDCPSDAEALQAMRAARAKG